MPQSQKRIEQLMEEMPYLRKIRYWATHLGEEVAALEQVSIQVKRADPNFMFRIPTRNTGTGRFLRNDEHPEWMGTVNEVYYAINQEGEPGRGRAEAIGLGDCVRGLFIRPIRDWADNADGQYGQDAFEVIQCIVWVRSIIWSIEDVHELEGKPVHVDIEITVFREPTEGWMRLFVDSDPLETVILSGSSLWPNSGVMEGFRDVVADRLSRLALLFEHDVLRNGLWQFIDASDKKGMSGRIGDVRIMSYVIMGRLLIQLERGGVSIAFGGVEEERSNLNYSSVSGRLPAVSRIVTDASDWWSQMNERMRSKTLVDDPNVNMGI